MQTLGGTRKNLIYFHLECAHLAAEKRITISGEHGEEEAEAEAEERGRWSFFACIDFFRKLCSVQGKIAGQKMDVLSLLHAMISI